MLNVSDRLKIILEKEKIQNKEIPKKYVTLKYLRANLLQECLNS